MQTMKEYIEERLVHLKLANEESSTGTWDGEICDYTCLLSAVDLEDGDVFEDMLDDVLTEVREEVLDFIANKQTLTV